MQCRLPRKNVPNKKSSRTWYFNETVSWDAAATYNADFTCDGAHYDAINLTHSSNPRTKLYIRYHTQGITTWKDVAIIDPSYYPPFRWLKGVYRTITFDAPPTGDLLTWLKANATPQ